MMSLDSAVTRRDPLRKTPWLGLPLVFLIVSVFAALAAGFAPEVAEDRGGVLVLDDSDPDYKGKETYADNLTSITGSGKIAFSVSGINNCQSIGSNHLIATDRDRGWIWFAEIVGKRIRKLDRSGKELLALNDIKASSLSVDPPTGNLWVVTTKGTIDGDQVVVFDTDGAQLKSYPIGGCDIAYDGKSKAFWIAGRTLTKISVETGVVAFTREITTWCASSLSVNPSTGMAWVTVREHPQVVGSKNELLCFENDGVLKHQISLGDKRPFNVSIDPAKGMVWVANFRQSVQRYNSNGTLEAEHLLEALTSHPDSAGGGVWVVTPERTILLNSKGSPIKAVKHIAPTSQAWIIGW